MATRAHVIAFSTLLMLYGGGSQAQQTPDPDFSSRWQGPSAVQPGATEKAPQLKPPRKPSAAARFGDPGPAIDGRPLELRPPDITFRPGAGAFEKQKE